MSHIVMVDAIANVDDRIQREIINTGATQVEIRVLDPRMINNEQRRKARGIIGDIGLWCGHPPDYLHDFMKFDFCTKTDTEYFSLADTDVTTARLYINYLLDFCLQHDVPLKKTVLDYCDDVEATVYSCLIHKKCLLCGKKSELHHWDKVGSGRNRKTIIHEGLRAQPLCHEHHQECHNKGQQTFDNRHHIIALPLDKYLCFRYGLNYEID